jgi:hypothetical protein
MIKKFYFNHWYLGSGGLGGGGGFVELLVGE